MHIALATQSLLFAVYTLRSEASPRLRLFTTLSGCWLMTIAYSTLATKQHYAIDLPAGAALAVICHAAVFARRTP
jgi:membrane-associated phospholipid phosphatase